MKRWTCHELYKLPQGTRLQDNHGTIWVKTQRNRRIGLRVGNVVGTQTRVQDAYEEEGHHDEWLWPSELARQDLYEVIDTPATVQRSET